MPKLHCTHRAEWQLTPGKPAKRLSLHYQLGCDYGTPVIAIYKESDGVEPIYLCDSHATALGRSTTNRAGARPGTASEVHHPKPNAYAQAEIMASPTVEHAKPNGFPRAEKIAQRTAAGHDRATTDSVKIPDRNLVSGNPYGNSAKALVDETIWNLETGDYDVYRTALQQGKSRVEAAQAAGGQLAVVHRKINEYVLQLEAGLSESNVRINAVEVINKPLEQALLEIIGASALDDAAKDAAIERLGHLQETLNRGLGPEITVLQAQQIARAIGERANWGANSELPEELKPAYWAAYSSVRNAIVAAVPGALTVLERLTNLYVAGAELESAPQAKLPHHPDKVELQPLRP